MGFLLEVLEHSYCWFFQKYSGAEKQRCWKFWQSFSWTIVYFIVDLSENTLWLTHPKEYPEKYKLEYKNINPEEYKLEYKY